jgi:hypothetical protein
VQHISVPGLEIGLSQIEDAEASVLFRCIGCEQIRTVDFLIVVELFDDTTDAFFGDLGNGRVVLSIRGFGKLDEDELAVSAVLLV